MKNKKSKLKNWSMPLAVVFVVILCCAALSSCNDQNEDMQTDDQYSQTVELKQIPLEDALATLEDFLLSNEQDMCATRSGASRKIADITTYYGTGGCTRTASDGVPDAYLVNFENDGGYAVLGANNAVPRIIAVTEGGRILDDLTVVSGEEDDYYGVDFDDLENFDWYCEEDDDYYTASASISTDLINNALAMRKTFDGSEDNAGSGHTVDGPSATPMPEKAPMLQTNWGQDYYGYNKYCYRDNGKKQAKTGCSATAMAMITAYNEFPKSLNINGKLLNWKEMKKHTTIDSLSTSGYDDVALLMGSIYNHVKKIPGDGYTLITPEQIKKRMQDFGYKNVKKYSDSKLNSDMKLAIANMLTADKPVFISAIPEIGHITSAHSWVIDGAKYSFSATGECVLHFNFGWYGYNNGYFSTSCLNPIKAENYDDPYKVDYAKDYEYTWHFRVITYDVPKTCDPLSITF